jgi:hypothetical protein
MENPNKGELKVHRQKPRRGPSRDPDSMENPNKGELKVGIGDFGPNKHFLGDSMENPNKGELKVLSYRAIEALRLRLSRKGASDRG